MGLYYTSHLCAAARQQYLPRNQLVYYIASSERTNQDRTMARG
jgi:hypothetical protein